MANPAAAKAALKNELGTARLKSCPYTRLHFPLSHVRFWTGSADCGQRDGGAPA